MWKPKYSFKYMNSFIGNNVILKLSTNINIRIGKFLSVSKQNVDGDYTVQIRDMTIGGLNSIVSNLIEYIKVDNSKYLLSKFVYVFPELKKNTNFDIALYEIGSYLTSEYIYL